MTSHKVLDGNFVYNPTTSVNNRISSEKAEQTQHVNSNSNIIDTSFSEDELIWFDYLKNTWNLWKKGNRTNEVLVTWFEQSSNPFHFCLKVLVNSSDCKDCKQKTMPYHIIERLKWWKATKSDFNVNFLPLNLKIATFEAAVQQKNLSFLKITVEAYDILSERNVMIPIIEDMLNRHRYKEAHQGVMALNIHEKFSIEKLLVPLILQDKLCSVNEYLLSCLDQVRPLVEFLDNLLDKNSTVKNLIEKFILDNDIPDVKWEKLNHKPLGKLIARLCATYELPITTCRNLCHNRTSGGLRFLVHQKFFLNAVSYGAWEDLIKDNLKRCPEMKHELVALIDEYDSNEALKWAKYFDLPLEDYPCGARYLISCNRTGVQSANADNWDEEPSTSKDHYGLSLPVSSVVFVDNHEGFHEFLKVIKKCEFVGIDSEWKPSFGATRNNVALIQVATTENVFLLDTMTLNKTEDGTLWKSLWMQLFENVNIVKIGFGLENDLREIKNSLPGLSNIKVKGLGLLELSNMWRYLRECGVSLPYESENCGESLSCLVENCFGVSLRKHEQCSNWEIRPLRNAQIEYAALDAYVLVEIYVVFKRLCLQHSINFDQLCYSIMVENKVPKAKSIPKDKKQNLTPIPSEKVKFFVDCKYEFLIASLRKCGIDTLTLPANSAWSEVVNLALDDGRFLIIGNSKGYNLNLLSKSNYLEIKNVHKDGCVDFIFKYFNIAAALDKSSARCRSCNSAELRTIAPDLLRKYYNREMNGKSQNDTGLIRLPYLNTSKTVEYRDFDPDAFLSDEDDDDCPLPYQATNEVSNLHREECFSDDATFDELSNVKLDLNGLTESIISSNVEFFVCLECRKCSWNN